MARKAQGAPGTHTYCDFWSSSAYSSTLKLLAAPFMILLWRVFSFTQSAIVPSGFVISLRFSVAYMAEKHAIRARSLSQAPRTTQQPQSIFLSF